MPEGAPPAARQIRTGRYWYRIARLGPLYFSSDSNVRFSCPGIPGGVLYLGHDPETCYWEVFWDSLASREEELRLPKKYISERKVHRARITRTIKVFDAANPVLLKAIGANGVGCFNGPYDVARTWTAHLYAWDPTLDGIRFPSARAGGGINLALFGGRVAPKDIAFEKGGTSLERDAAITKLILRENITLIA